MKTIDTKAMEAVSGAYGWGGYRGAYGYGGYGGGWANPYAGYYRAERAAAWSAYNQNNYLVPLTAAYLASRW